mmetsp:Transcript_7250/g.13417  ORF Transcript_7250/g.13417 Transcript_7250/m.13417 type:complete len:252 (-) Transcript_7250:2978-3733(-)
MISEEKFSPAALLPGRLHTLQADLDSILAIDFPNFEAFKTYWKDNNISLLHHCLQPRESHVEFYQALWGYLLNAPTQRVAIYALYCFYFTQVKQRVPINIDLSRWKDLLYSTKSDVFVCSLIKALAVADAFSFGVVVGLKTLLVDKSGNPLTTRIVRKTIKSSEEPSHYTDTRTFDVTDIQEAATNYSMLKADLKKTLNKRQDVYFRSPDSKDELLNRLSSSDMRLLELSDPLLPLKLPRSPSSDSDNLQE